MRCPLAALAALALAACSNDTIDDVDVNPDTIWGTYETHFDEESSDLRLHAQFRVGGPTGTTVRLTGDARVEVDGDRLSVVDGDSTPFNVLGTYYTANRSVRSPREVYGFTWTRYDRRSFFNPVAQAAPIDVVAPALDVRVPRDASLIVRWSGGLELGERVEARVESEQGAGIASQTVSGGDRVVLPADRLASLPLGSARVRVIRTLEESTREGHPESGGQRVSTYASRSVRIRLVDE